jgi:hypothetical protein
VVENLSHLFGELIFERASSAPDGERQSHDVFLLKSPVEMRLRVRIAWKRKESEGLQRSFDSGAFSPVGNARGPIADRSL